MTDHRERKVAVVVETDLMDWRDVRLLYQKTQGKLAEQGFPRSGGWKAIVRLEPVAEQPEFGLDEQEGGE